MAYYFSTYSRLSFDETVDKTIAELKAQGFGVLTEIDLQATLKKKVGKDMDRHLILGACNPHLASQALDAVPQVAVLLPCTVCIREVDGGVMVEAMDPGMISTISGAEALEPIAAEARARINGALARLR